MTAPRWVENTQVGLLRADDLLEVDRFFRHGAYVYRTLGTHLAAGGMGSVSNLERRLEGDGPVEAVVGKTFHATYLHQLRSDEITRRDHQVNLAAMSRLAALNHPALLPTYVATAIADNYLFVTPRMDTTLLAAIPRHGLTARRRTELLTQALEALAHLHDARLLHRDFTLRNILIDEPATRAYLFDFDLTLSLEDIAGATFGSYYRGRVFGSPGYSVAPETIDAGLAELPLAPSLDIFAVGGALHALFTDQLPYGPSADMWGLLMRISDGVVVAGKSSVHYPDAVPRPLRPIIDRCLERDPHRRYPSVARILDDLRAVALELDARSPPPGSASTSAAPPDDRATRLHSVLARRGDPSVTSHDIERADTAVASWGYELRRSLGRVKGHPVYVAHPRPELVAAGSFPDANIFPKTVTVIDLHAASDPRALVDAWTRVYLPTLKQVRRGMMTTLHKVILDTNTGSLLLFSEFIDDPRFGSALAEIDLHLDGGLALGLLVTRQVALLHERGMAHNNIHPGALLFKAARDTRLVQPAMIGLVEPSLSPDAIATDVRALAAMIGAWLRPARVAALNVRLRPLFEEIVARLYAFDADTDATPRIDALLAAVSNGLALVDFNYAVLRDAGGDLDEHSQLVVSHRLFHLLWPEQH